MHINLKSEGECLFCKQIFPQSEIGSHLAKHLKEKEMAHNGFNTKVYCHVEVEAREMFLHLLVEGDAEMSLIDYFLRDIWLDCCDHLSGFSHKNFKVEMNDQVQQILQPQVKIVHSYDYGTTTSLQIKARKHYHLEMESPITLLSRNEPLKLLCGLCKKKPAVAICTTCNWNEYAYFCETCSITHEETCEEFADYSNMPVVNSPRMGECGYTGGRIDLDRDGVYKK